ncbi:ATPase, T2SS/T4P/T4SS family [Siminovitchia sediminis]|uniref:ATPase, T2SS/T4P/T4SS family n=1 Tax=Siminovitchia sediminis TaxID=1274353 RepID=A0ABW4KGF5_9BACI
MNNKRIQEIIDHSFLKVMLQDDAITDIRFNGTHLWVQYNDKPYQMASIQPKEEEVRRLVKSMAMEQKKDITDSEPILDTDFEYLRINAVHESVSPDGTTLAVRVSRPRLAVRNIQEMLPKISYEKSTPIVVDKTEINKNPVASLLKVLVLAGSNIMISGITGTGKTELQKLLVGLIPNNQKINLLEDTRDSHIKALYPDKDIMSWQTLTSEDREKKVTMQDLVKASLRNNPDWIIVAETRGAESSDMLDGAKTGHSIVTTVHAKNAMRIPSRFIPMIKQSPAYQTIDEQIIGKEITELFRFGMHLQLEFVNNKAIRRIKEIVEYTDYTPSGVVGRHLYKYQEVYDPKSKLYVPKETINPLSNETLTMLEDKKLFHLLPDEFIKSDYKKVWNGVTIERR